jgi:hypothetical protein
MAAITKNPMIRITATPQSFPDRMNDRAKPPSITVMPR